MSENYDTKLCEEKHKVTDGKLELHDRRLNDHSYRLKKLEQYRSQSEEKIQNLCKDIQSLINTIKWFMGILVTSFIGFFFYAVQTHLFK